ncbi:MAG: ABC transporter substrate-binding protein [Desulfosudis oleivorans]|nr:ABC transporter substrate-binding protein [Desulfosudis oleivorans]
MKRHDGEEFTADDVLFTYETVTNPKIPTPYSSNYGPVGRVEAVDRYTVRVRYKKPYAPALESWGMGILPKHVLAGKDITSPEVNRNPAGTGPYRPKEWVTGQKIVLDASEDYYEGRPGINQLSREDHPRYGNDVPRAEIRGNPISMGPHSSSNTSSRPRRTSSTVAFRNSVTPPSATPISGTTSSIPSSRTAGSARPPRTGSTSARSSPAFSSDTACPALGRSRPNPGLQPERQGSRVQPRKGTGTPRRGGTDEKCAAGRLEKNGKPLALLRSWSTRWERGARMKSAQIIKEQLRRIGIDMTIKVLEWQALLHEFINKRRFEAVIMGWALSRDPDIHDIWRSLKDERGRIQLHLLQERRGRQAPHRGGGRPSTSKKGGGSITGSMKSSPKISPARSCTCPTPSLCSTSASRVSRRRPSGSGTTLSAFGMCRRAGN